jgi:hypothetical protein
MLSIYCKLVLETAVMSAPETQHINLLVKCKLVFTGTVVNEGGIRIFLNHGIKTFPMAAIECTLEPVQMAMLLFEQNVFIAKSVNKATYSD